MTLISKLKSGEISEVVKKVAHREKVSIDRLIEYIVQGKVVVPKNVAHKIAHPVGIGKGLSTKVNANIGTSEDFPSLEEELKKLKVAISAGADTVMDLSTGGDLDAIRRKMVKECPVPLGTVPIYQAAIEAKDKFSSIVAMTPEHIFEVIEKQAKDGVDFMTIHAGVTSRTVDALRKVKRVAGVVSRGGAILIGWMIHQSQENPLYANFERILEVARRYEVTLSLGDGMRPGAIADATDKPQLEELMILGELVEEARAAGVQAMVEGPGHVPINQIKTNVKLEKKICKDAPFYVLGPIVTDVAPGYDHLTSAIGGAIAACEGADFLCYVTPREHLGLPTREDVRAGVITSKIAAHAADVARGITGALEWDLEMSKARKALDWSTQMKLAIDSESAEKAYEERKISERDECSMCGEFCAIKLVADYLDSSSSPKCV